LLGSMRFATSALAVVARGYVIPCGPHTLTVNLARSAWLASEFNAVPDRVGDETASFDYRGA
jgi:hypothetical protein